MKLFRSSFLPLLIIASLIGFGIVYVVRNHIPEESPSEPTPAKKPEIGDILHTHNGVHIYENGDDYTVSHSKHFSADGYYYGHQWQCVEFIKRYYFDAHQHRMPNVMGHAKDFFSTSTKHGEINPERAMLQYKNGGNEAPQVDDLLVWNEGNYGHVAIISEVKQDSVTIVQQNVKGKATQSLSLARFRGHYLISEGNPPAGWLRLPNKTEN